MFKNAQLYVIALSIILSHVQNGHTEQSNIDIPNHAEHSHVIIPSHTEHSTVSITEHSTISIHNQTNNSTASIPHHTQQSTVSVPHHTGHSTVSITEHSTVSIHNQTDNSTASIPHHTQQSTVSVPHHTGHSTVSITEHSTVSIHNQTDNGTASIPHHTQQSTSSVLHRTGHSSVSISRHTGNSTARIHHHTWRSTANNPKHIGHSTVSKRTFFTKAKYTSFDKSRLNTKKLTYEELPLHPERLTINHTDYANLSMTEMMTKLGIIPHVLPDRPYEKCEVTYEYISAIGNRYIHSVVPGEHLLDNETIFPPQVKWRDADKNSLYTIYLCGSTKWRKDLYPTVKPLELDADYPQMAEWENWITINIPGCDIPKGNNLAEYLAPGNPLYHHVEEYFAFLVFKQTRRIPYVPLKVAEDIEKNGQPRFHFPDDFKVTDFIKMHNLTGPIALNFFVTKYQSTIEDYKSSLEAQRLANMTTTPMMTTTTYPTHRLNTLKENILNMLKNYSKTFFS